jgi:hypothetical protein
MQTAQLSQQELDAVVGGRMNLPVVRPQQDALPGAGGTGEESITFSLALYNLIAHTLP